MIPNIFNFASNKYLQMIQRIQTLYLLIADLLIAILFFVPFAEIAGKDGGLYLLNVVGLQAEGTSLGAFQLKTWPLQILMVVILLGLILILFQFKNRILQIKLSYAAILFQIILSTLLVFYAWSGSTQVGGTYSLKIFFTFPLIAAVIVFLAIRGMVRDENLVKSIDRIR